MERIHPLATIANDQISFASGTHKLWEFIVVELAVRVSKEDPVMLTGFKPRFDGSTISFVFSVTDETNIVVVFFELKYHLSGTITRSIINHNNFVGFGDQFGSVARINNR